MGRGEDSFTCARARWEVFRGRRKSFHPSLLVDSLKSEWHATLERQLTRCTSMRVGRVRSRRRRSVSADGGDPRKPRCATSLPSDRTRAARKGRPTRLRAAKKIGLDIGTSPTIVLSGIASRRSRAASLQATASGILADASEVSNDRDEGSVNAPARTPRAWHALCRSPSSVLSHK